MGLSVEQVARVYESRYGGFRIGAAAILNDFEAAHDAVQDAFAQALADRAKCRGTSPEAWIWRIVERKAFAELRRRGKVAPDYELDPEFLRSDQNPALLLALKALSPRRRLVIFLRYMADLSYADIGRLCNMSEGTVGATLAQARAELVRRLQLEEVQR